MKYFDALVSYLLFEYLSLLKAHVHIKGCHCFLNLSFSYFLNREFTHEVIMYTVICCLQFKFLNYADDTKKYREIVLFF